MFPSNENGKQQLNAKAECQLPLWYSMLKSKDTPWHLFNHSKNSQIILIFMFCCKILNSDKAITQSGCKIIISSTAVLFCRKSNQPKLKIRQLFNSYCLMRLVLIIYVSYYRWSWRCEKRCFVINCVHKLNDYFMSAK